MTRSRRARGTRSSRAHVVVTAAAAAFLVLAPRNAAAQPAPVQPAPHQPVPVVEHESLVSTSAGGGVPRVVDTSAVGNEGLDHATSLRATFSVVLGANGLGSDTGMDAGEGASSSGGMVSTVAWDLDVELPLVRGLALGFSLGSRSWNTEAVDDAGIGRSVFLDPGLSLRGGYVRPLGGELLELLGGLTIGPTFLFWNPDLGDALAGASAGEAWLDDGSGLFYSFDATLSYVWTSGFGVRAGLGYNQHAVTYQMGAAGQSFERNLDTGELDLAAGVLYAF